MNVFITGASRGIGKAIKEYFEQQGHKVLSPSRAEADLGSAESLSRYLQEHKLDHIDILINNAGINELAEVEQMDDEVLMRTMQTNLFSAFRLIRHFLPVFKQKNFGRIVNIGSIWVGRAMPKRGAYGMSKEALYSLTKMTAAEESQHNILCNMLSPGFIATELTYQNNTEEQIGAFLKSVPCKRMGSPEEVAKACYFLSVDNTFITGQNIFIDGGYTINY